MEELFAIFINFTKNVFFLVFSDCRFVRLAPFEGAESGKDSLMKLASLEKGKKADLVFF